MSLCERCRCPPSSVLSPERPTDSANIDPGRLSLAALHTALQPNTTQRERDEEMEIRSPTLNYLCLTGLTLTLARPLHLTHLAHNRANQTLNQSLLPPSTPSPITILPDLKVWILKLSEIENLSHLLENYVERGNSDVQITFICTQFYTPYP